MGLEWVSLNHFSRPWSIGAVSGTLSWVGGLWEPDTDGDWSVGSGCVGLYLNNTHR